MYPMMISRSKSALLLMAFTVLFSARSIHAQEGPPRPSLVDAQKESEQRQELEKKTLALVDEIASEAWGLKLPENRLFVISNVADLLWTSDQKRARNLYWEALNSIDLVTPRVRSTGETITKADQQKVLQAYMTRFTFRQTLLRQVAQRDSQLALEMLRATRQVPPRLGLEVFLPDDRQLEQEIAGEVAARDPAYALQVARESLAKGLTLELMNFLSRLNDNDSNKASEFAGEVIGKLRTTNIATNIVASIIAVQLLEASRKREVNRPVLSAGSGGSVKFLILNDEQKRDLVDVVTNAALSVNANSNLLFDVSEVMPEIQQFFPERRTALERKLSVFNQTLTKQQRESNNYNAAVRSGRPEDIVRLAATARGEDRLVLYQQAAITAAMSGSGDSFRELVSDEVNDEGDQQKILDLLDSEEISVLAHHKQLDRLKQLLPKIRRKEERARAMVETALLLKEKGEDTEAATLLDEAATLMKTDLKSETQTNALLTLLCAYALIDPPKAFALAERIIDQANSQISLLMLVDRVVQSGAVKKSEILLNHAGLMPLSFLVFRYGKGVAALAKADFNRTRALADRFERNELRVLARLFIVKGILNGTSG